MIDVSLNNSCQDSGGRKVLDRRADISTLKCRYKNFGEKFQQKIKEATFKNLSQICCSITELRSEVDKRCDRVRRESCISCFNKTS
jgi:hypothetical protein